MNLKYDHKYDDIIDKEYHKSEKHPQMSLYARSSKFAAFAALTGYEELVEKTAKNAENSVEN